MNDEAGGLKAWCIVELMGHQQLAGEVSEELVAGKPMLRVDVPGIEETDGDEGRPAFTRYYGAAAVYAITPCDEEEVREFVAYYRPRRMPVYLPVKGLIEEHTVAALPPGDDMDEDVW